jgi:hypothetical protein
MATRKFSSISVETTLASTIGATGTTMTVATGTGSGLLGGVTLSAGNVDQFTVAIDPDTTNEEIVFITANSGDSFTIVRARAGTSGISHSAGATVKHVLTSDDLSWFESNTSPVDSMGFSGSASGTTTVQASAVASGTLTLPAATDTLVGKATTDTLTNKTLTAPVISTISNSGTVTIPTGTDTLVARTSTDTLTNKTLTSPTINDARQNITLNAQTGTTYTPVLTDNGRLVTLSNASAITLTVPTNASVAYATGAIINIQQIGAGQVTVTGDTGVTVNGTGTKTRAQWSAASLIKTATDTWTLIGDLE